MRSDVLLNLAIFMPKIESTNLTIKHTNSNFTSVFHFVVLQSFKFAHVPCNIFFYTLLIKMRKNCKLTLNLLTTTIVAPPSNASKWQVGFNSSFKGLNNYYEFHFGQNRYT